MRTRNSCNLCSLTNNHNKLKIGIDIIVTSNLCLSLSLFSKSFHNQKAEKKKHPPTERIMRPSIFRSIHSAVSRSRSHLPRRGYATEPVPERKVAILGAAGGIGQPLSLLMKLNPLVSTLSLYDIAGTPGVAADVSHINSRSEVPYIFYLYSIDFDGFLLYLIDFSTCNSRSDATSIFYAIVESTVVPSAIAC